MNLPEFEKPAFTIQKEVPSTHVNQPSNEAPSESSDNKDAYSGERLQCSWNDERFQVALGEVVQTPVSCPKLEPKK